MQIVQDTPRLARRCHEVWLETRQDGYPTSSLGDGSGPANVTEDFVEACPECNGEGTIPFPQWQVEEPVLRGACSECNGTGKVTVTLSVPQHSDRTGELAVADKESNVAGAALSQARSLFAQAEKLAEQGRAKLLDAVNPPSKPEKEPVDTTTDWCARCLTVTRVDSEGRKSKVMNPTVTVEVVVAGDAPLARCSACLGWAHDAVLNPEYPKERPRALILLEAEGRPLTTRAVEDAIGVKL